MTATLLVTIEVEEASPEQLQLTANEMQDALEQAGFPVESVQPWSRDQTAMSNPTVEQITAALPTDQYR